MEQNGTLFHDRCSPCFTEFALALSSRPDEERNNGWAGEKGRVNAIVEKYVEEFGLTAEDTLIYACGHPGMIEDVKEQFLPKGFKVEEERFWKED